MFTFKYLNRCSLRQMFNNYTNKNVRFAIQLNRSNKNCHQLKSKVKKNVNRGILSFIPTFQAGTEDRCARLTYSRTIRNVRFQFGLEKDVVKSTKHDFVWIVVSLLDALPAHLQLKWIELHLFQNCATLFQFRASCVVVVNLFLMFVVLSFA